MHVERCPKDRSGLALLVGAEEEPTSSKVERSSPLKNFNNLQKCITTSNSSATRGKERERERCDRQCPYDSVGGRPVGISNCTPTL